VAGVPRRFRWEKAARGTDGRYFTWGNQWQDSATNWAGSGINGTNAIAYAQWQGQQDQHTYRLPTAEEWEKAARGTDGRYFTWGNPWQDSATNWAGSGINGTNAIAAFPLSRSLYGVEDMAGNVFEYTSTLRHLGTQTLAVMKGCSWDDSPGFCRAAYQHTRPVASRHILFGFRLVRE
jgi:formylglycine-generating enzyme required for sulfatase activity